MLPPVRAVEANLFGFVRYRGEPQRGIRMDGLGMAKLVGSRFAGQLAGPKSQAQLVGMAKSAGPKLPIGSRFASRVGHEGELD